MPWDRESNEEYDALEAESWEFKKLIARVDKSIAKENA